MRRLLLAFAAVTLAACSAGSARPRYLRQSGGRLTNPLLDLREEVEFTELRSFRRKLDALVASATAEGGVRHASVYFHDLNNGPWFGVNERAEFSPASLFKVPMLMAILREAEDAPGLLEQLAQDDTEGGRTVQDPPPARTVVKGRPYTVDELLTLMIVHSDNRAHDLLLAYLDRRVFERIFTDLGYTPPDISARDAAMSVKSYASFFRILYNASYLSRRSSEKALALLVEADFPGGLRAGVPAGTVVAQKFGERSAADGRERQYHDCGIVYHPAKPYLLCVMTRGQDAKKLVGFIAETSRLVYAEVDAQTRGR